MPFVPEREREEPPELPREILVAGDMAIEYPLDGFGPEVALPPQRFRTIS